MRVDYLNDPLGAHAVSKGIGLKQEFNHFDVGSENRQFRRAHYLNGL